MSSDKSKLLVSLSSFVVLTAAGASVYLLSHFADGGHLLPWFIGLLVSAGLLFCALLFALSRFYERRIEFARRESEESLRLAREVAELHTQTIESLAIAIDAKDQTSQGHVRRTRIYAAELGKLLNVTAAEMEALKAGALLHDIGKLAVPDYILNKPGRLTAAEFEKMKVHAAVGGDIIRRVNFPYPVEEIVRFHHEKWDGTGYPAGLKGEQIPLVARVISVVDFYDSTRCDRPYRAGMSREESLALLRRMAGKAFDPAVVVMFAKNIDHFDALISQQDISEQVHPSKEATASKALAGAGSVNDLLPSPDIASGFRSIADAQREVFALHEFAQIVGASLNLQDTAALVAARLRSIVRFDTCVIFAVEEKTRRAAPVQAVGENSEFFACRSVAAGEGITGWVIANARPMYAAHPELDMRGVPTEIASCVRAVISAPLVREDGAFGAITLYSTGDPPYTADQIRLLESVCLHASSALGNALTHERTKESALTDSVTSLPNARALRLLLDQRVAECQRMRSGPLSLLSIDVDDFHLVNEELGHGVGDRLLAAVAGVIKGQLRQMDMLARYAGDEFIAVLPSANDAEAAAVAERVRMAVLTHKFHLKTGRAAQVEVSIGVGCYPEAGDTADELLMATTQNMQRNKHARKLSHGTSSSVVSIDAYR
ncbi:MAG TPA: HD domain-containing phosphohydrolase [Pyrinomonadaceae bacterium]|jgi:diguanylate cyclase (GGDEF)-like protein/putative nucleotidyltransferase with HDIG domain|nr:HD domain-containing phosphohydrolase [Pyrinomonadaceae bacterium]